MKSFILERCQTTMDKSSKHLKDVEREMDELQRGFCIRLCCPSKSKKSQEDKLNENSIPIEQDFIYSNDQFQNLDENLQRLQYFNKLIDNEMQDQLQTLVCF
jgi:hypothetical protein